MAISAVSLSGLKNNPTAALRQTKQDLVVVLNRDHPDAVLVGLDQDGLVQAPGVHAAQATAPSAMATSPFHAPQELRRWTRQPSSPISPDWGLRPSA